MPGRATPCLYPASSLRGAALAGAGVWQHCPRGSLGAWPEAGARGCGLAVQWACRRGSGLGPSRPLADGWEAGPAGARQPMDAQPPSSYKGPERGRRGGGRWGEARLAEARRRPGRTGPQAVVAGPWRRRPLLRVPGCSSSCWRRRQRWSRGRRVSGNAAGLADGCGARGPGPASGSLPLFLKHGAGPGAQVAAPARGRASLAWRPPRKPRAGSAGGAGRGGAGACV